MTNTKIRSLELAILFCFSRYVPLITYTTDLQFMIPAKSNKNKFVQSNQTNYTKIFIKVMYIIAQDTSDPSKIEHNSIVY